MKMVEFIIKNFVIVVLLINLSFFLNLFYNLYIYDGLAKKH